MAKSTGIVVTAGVVALADVALTGWDPRQGTRIAAAGVLAALVSAGLDRVVPSLGTGLAVLLLMASVLRSGPVIAERLFPPVVGFGPRG